jgi:hypothetical protein
MKLRTKHRLSPDYDPSSAKTRSSDQPQGCFQANAQVGIRSQVRKPKLYKKLEEIGTYHRYPNVLNREFVATKRNQKWVSDV